MKKIETKTDYDKIPTQGTTINYPIYIKEKWYKRLLNWLNKNYWNIMYTICMIFIGMILEYLILL